jgi:ornithine cyclodeaminase
MSANMIRFIGAADMGRLATLKGLERLIAELADTIKADFLRWDEFDKSGRVAHHSALGVIELMPIADRELYSFKYVNGHPQNTAVGLPTVMAFGALAEIDTGNPVLLSEMTLVTALRTAATSALAAKMLARPDSISMALIGNGAQAEFQVLAFKAMLGIREIRAYDTDPAATAKLIRNLAHVDGLRMVAARSVTEAVHGADIVTTATADKANATILTPQMIEPGMHINAIGGDCPGKTELHPDILGSARVVVEYAPQTRIEGEIQQLPEDFPVTELWRVIARLESARDDPEQVTVFDSVGFAIEDFSALRYLRDAAERYELGTLIDLVATPQDPKNLFALMATEQTPRAIVAKPAAPAYELAS